MKIESVRRGQEVSRSREIEMPFYFRSPLFLLLSIVVLSGVSCQPSPKPKTVSEKELIRLLSNKNDLSVRLQAAEQLSELKKLSRSTIKAIIKKLNDPSPNIRASLVYTLGESRELSNETARAIASMLGDSDELVVWLAICVCCQRGPEMRAAVPALTQLVLNEAGTCTLKNQLEAMDALQIIQPNNNIVIPRLTKMLGNPSWKVRRRVIYALGSYKRKALSAVDELVLRLNDYHAEVRTSAAHALGRIGEGTPEVVRGITALLHDDIRTVRRFAVDALKKLRCSDEKVVQALITLLRGKDIDLKKSALDALGMFGSESRSAVPSVVACLTKEHPLIVRRFAAQALYQIGPQIDHLQQLVTLIKEPDQELQALAEMSICSVVRREKEALPRALNLLDSLIENGNPEVSKRARILRANLAAIESRNPL